MSDPVDLADARWRRNSSPNGHEPTEALRAALRAIESGEVNPIHIVVCVAGQVEEGGTKTSYYQAGTYSYHGQLGLLDAVGDLMDRND